MKKLLILFLLAPFIGMAQLSQTFKNHWFDGFAEINSYELIYYWITGKYREAYLCLAQIRELTDIDLFSNRHHKIYLQYILNICYYFSTL